MQQPNQQNLHSAAERGDAAAVLACLKAGADVTACNTALQLALQGSTPEHLVVAELLLEHGADPNVLDDLHQTPLHAAASFCRVPAARLLLQHGAKATVQDTLGRTPLSLAVRLGHSSMVQLLCEHIDASQSTALESLQSVVRLASEQKQWECWAHLLKAGAKLGGLEWVCQQVTELGAADCSLACTAVVQAWVGETAAVTDQQEQLQQRRRDLVDTGVGVRHLLLAALPANKQQRQQTAMPQQADQQRTS